MEKMVRKMRVMYNKFLRAQLQTGASRASTSRVSAMPAIHSGNGDKHRKKKYNNSGKIGHSSKERTSQENLAEKES